MAAACGVHAARRAGGSPRLAARQASPRHWTERDKGWRTGPRDYRVGIERGSSAHERAGEDIITLFSAACAHSSTLRRRGTIDPPWTRPVPGPRTAAATIGPSTAGVCGGLRGRIPSEPRKPRSTAPCGHKTFAPEQLSRLSHYDAPSPVQTHLTHLQGASETDLRNGGSSLGPPASGWRRSREHDKSGVWRTRATPCTARSFPGDPSNRARRTRCRTLQTASDHTAIAFRSMREARNPH